MNHYSLCIECQESDPLSLVCGIGELTNELYAICTCPKGHKFLSGLMLHVPDILYTSAVQAFRKGCYSESILSFTAAFERICELFFKTFCLKYGSKVELVYETWNELKNQSERQYGAFCIAYCISTKSAWKADTKQIEFRNKVVHKGYIATRTEVESYAEYITTNIDKIITILNKDFEDECREIFFYEKKLVQPKIDKLIKDNPSFKYVATGKVSLLRWNHGDRKSITFTEVIQLAVELDANVKYSN